MGGGPAQLSNQSGLQHVGGSTQNIGNINTTGQTTGQTLGQQTGSSTGTNISGFQAPSWATPLLEQIAGGASNLYSQQQGINPILQQGITGAQGYAQGQAPMMGALTNYLNPYARGDYAQGGSPAFLAAQDRAAGQLADRINLTASSAGRYGSGAQANALGSNLTNFFNATTAPELARQQGLQLQAIGQMPGAYGAGLLPFQTLQQAGQTAQGAPWQGLSNFSNILAQLNPAQYGTRFGTQTQDTTGTNIGQTSGTTAGTQASNNTLLNDLNTITNQLGSQQQSGGGTGQALGAMLPMMASLLLSDERAKENIEPVGKLKDGQNVYRFNYRGNPTTHIGLIAQEVMKHRPDAVAPMMGGILGVDYAKATEDAVRGRR